MKKNCAFFLLIGIFLTGCSKNSEPAELEIEAGNHELLAVLCAYEGIARTGDRNYTINIIDNDGWNPFDDGKTHAVKYEKVSVTGNKKQEKAINISITDTIAPTIVTRSETKAEVIPYSDDMEDLRKVVEDMIKDAFVVMDNSSTSPLVFYNDEDFILDPFDAVPNETQTITFHVYDPSGNTADGSMEVIFFKP